MRKDPFETSYRRWRHKTHGYVVEIQKILHYRGDDNYYYSTIVVKGSRKRRTAVVAWSSEIFHDNFRPIKGSKSPPKTALEHILNDCD